MLRSLVGSGAPPEALELLGACLGAQGRHAEALECIDRALRSRTPSAAALHNRAQALLALGRVQEARGDLDRALSLDPRFPPAWTALGRAWRPSRTGQARSAPTGERPRCSPRRRRSTTWRGFSTNDGRVEPAIAGYRKALALDPSLVAARNNLAIALREAGRLDEAIALLEGSARDPAAPPEILNSLGVAYYARGRFADAEACYHRALGLSPAMDEVEINLGNALSAQVARTKPSAATGG
jgi:tetratricopeptide (TPR) repeat protein